MNTKKKITVFLLTLFLALIVGAIIATILDYFQLNFFDQINLPSWLKK